MVTEQTWYMLDGWDTKSHDLGTIEYQDHVMVVFTYTGSKTIKRVETTCNCIGTIIKKYNPEQKVILKWRLKVPYNGPIKSKKLVTVIFDDGSEADLEIRARIIA